MKNTTVKRVKPAQPIASIALAPMVVPALTFEHEGVCVLHCLSTWSTTFVTVAPTLAVLKRVPSIALTSIVRGLDGRVLGVGSRSGQRTYTLFAIDLATGQIDALPLLDRWNDGPARLLSVRGDVLAIPTRDDREALGYDGLMLSSGRTLRLPAAPRPGAFSEIEAYPLADGATLLIAGTVPFRWDGDALDRIESIASLVVYNLGASPQGALTDDGALLLCAADDLSRDNGRVLIAGERAKTLSLRAITVDGAMRYPAPTAVRAYPAMAAAEGAVVLKQNDPPEKDLFKVYWPRERALSSIPRSWLGLKSHAHDVLYSPTADALVVTQVRREPPTLFVLPWSDVARLPRTSASIDSTAQ